ncbi:MAG: DUF3551 domain-containing protein [Xanthobacteraceae bacterium]|jgi:hypothetical protein
MSSKSNLIRAAFAALCLSTFVGAAPQPAQADPYRWCAEYGGRGGGGRNCYFLTINQCRAAVSGVGGTCTPNPFFTGRPIVTPEDTFVVRAPRRVVYY